MYRSFSEHRAIAALWPVYHAIAVSAATCLFLQPGEPFFAPLDESPP